MGMRRIILPAGFTIFFLHYLTNGTIFGGEKNIQNEMCILIFSKIFLIWGIVHRDIIINVKHHHVKYQLTLSDFNKTWFFSKMFERKS
jgi:hypothetical protein